MHEMKTSTQMDALHAPDAQAPTNQRRYELDWLRVIVVLGLIPYHIAVVYALGPGDYVKSPQRSVVFDLLATMAGFWGMPLLFLVAGASSWFALGRRAPTQYLLERIERLAIPFAGGVLLLVPIQLYVERLATPGYNLNYLQFYETFLLGWLRIGEQGVFGLGFQYWGHLWFILYLLAVTAFLLPLLLWLRRPAAQHWLTRGAAFLTPGLNLSASAPGLLLLLGAPLVIVEVALQGPIGPSPATDYTNLYSGPAGLVLYAVAFVLGYIIFAEPRWQRALTSQRRPALALAVGLFVVYELILASSDAALVTTPLGALLIRCARAYITWLLLVAILGYAQRYLALDSPTLRYLNEACFPIYVLHMPIMSARAFFITRWPAPIIVTFPTLVAATATATFAIYEFAVRRVPAMRVLFGMKPRRVKATSNTYP
jgi:peptidoglycan/LPS O-acetylase OafA/YrhL